MTLRYRDLARHLASQPLAVEPGALHRLQELLASPADREVERDRMAAALGLGAATPVPASGVVAVLAFRGFVQQREDVFTRYGFAVSTEAFVRQVRQAQADPKVKAIVFDVDSPGGFVSGCPEACEAILALRGQKPMVAVSNGMMASAAYFVAGAADIVVATPSSLTGSIGVFGMHVDYSEALAAEGIKVNFISAGKYKVEANPYEPLGDTARAAWQREVDDFYAQFVKAVAKARGVPVGDVRSGFGEGRVLTARRAVAAGLASSVQPLDELLRKLAENKGGGARGYVQREVARAELGLTRATATHGEVERERARVDFGLYGPRTTAAAGKPRQHFRRVAAHPSSLAHARVAAALDWAVAQLGIARPRVVWMAPVTDGEPFDEFMELHGEDWTVNGWVRPDEPEMIRLSTATSLATIGCVAVHESQHAADFQSGTPATEHRANALARRWHRETAGTAECSTCVSEVEHAKREWRIA